MPESLLNHFNSLWAANTEPPDVFAFLKQYAAAKASEKLGVLLADQQHRWQCNQPITVEEYLAHLPELGADSKLKLELALGEFEARQTAVTARNIDAFSSRFAGIEELLRSKLQRLIVEPPGTVQPDPAMTATTPPANRSRGPSKGIAHTVDQITSNDVRRTGRHRLVRLLGEGTFGRVWLGFDEELRRQVAIKVPKPERFRKPEDAEAYLEEARTVAGLDHPNIVPVHEVGRGADGSVYVVSKYISGQNLAEVLQENPLTAAAAAILLATVARALQHAHQKRLVHRDIKPANILIEEDTGAAYVTDFGLAITEHDYLRDGQIAGTPAYMSPEQARGEGHRLDGRSDIFSLGVVMYELLTGKRPFRGTTMKELMHKVISLDPMSPREVKGDVPAELERICLKAISKRAANRYATAAEMADDLDNWQQGVKQPQGEIRIVPKGLRSFDAADAAFFLDLLPGPRNREGLPESIQFWKTRIETVDPDATFRVGLIYGPSGCGKSSLVKAGLLPRLSRDVICVYLEATPDETEKRIMRGLRKQIKKMPEEMGLVAAFTALRRRTGKKIVVIVDQFEQWLHSHRSETDNELVDAFRQCDGGQLQAIIMVRDDFWLAASRFMNEVEVESLQGQNVALVDLFDIDHSQKVLAKYGQAFGKLPQQSSNFSADENEFLGTIVNGLAENGKVVSVRIALLAEMIKSKPWLPATLEEVGGSEGIGVNFLEETFSSRSANPMHRQHQQAARAMLSALLPEAGAHIKGHMRSHAQLLEASGYQDRVNVFNDLLRVLDGELRLITPTDPEGAQADQGTNPDRKYYQLTHDYLVPSLRDWLFRKQHETRRGRAQLRLAERASLWIEKPENRYLPSIWEYMRIRLLTKKRKWTTAEWKMMVKARRVHRFRFAIFVLLVALIVVGGMRLRDAVVDEQSRIYAENREKQNITRVEGLVDGLTRADIAQVPAIARHLDNHLALADPLLKDHFEHAAEGSAERLNTALALLSRDESKAKYLGEKLISLTPREFGFVREALAPHKQSVVESLWETALDTSRPEPDRFQAACALATFAPEDERFDQISTLVATHLVSQQASDYLAWREALRPAKQPLIKPLTAIYKDLAQREQNRVYATETILDYAADQASALFELLTTADRFQFPQILTKLAAHRDAAVALGEAELTKKLPADAGEFEKELLAQRQANVAIALLKLGVSDAVWPLLQHSPDPRLRTYIIHLVSPLDVDPRILVDRCREESDLSARRALILALGEFSETQYPQSERLALIVKVQHSFQNDPDPGMHSAAEWLLRKWGEGAWIATTVDKLRADEKQITIRQALDKRLWYVNTQGQTFVQLKAGEVTMGSPPSEIDRSPEERQHVRKVDRRFSICTSEVTKEQFARFQLDFPTVMKVETEEWVKSDESAQVGMSWYEAAAYCNWLSKKEGILEEQWCYQPNKKGEYGPGMSAREKHLILNGYRLPTEAEWEFACRAGAVTSRFYGITETLLSNYAWYQANGKNHTWPAGLLKPNDFGLFDMHGNIYDWCEDIQQPYPKESGQVIEDSGVSLETPDGSTRVLRGGAFTRRSGLIRSANRTLFLPDTRSDDDGFRPVRTCP